ncbi:MAG TPA: hypothetical protein VFL86_11275 [Burkholderiaceae bacterium]|nr:hypothetical protein [Burkholderiaceae bacterium]
MNGSAGMAVVPQAGYSGAGRGTGDGSHMDEEVGGISRVDDWREQVDRHAGSEASFSQARGTPGGAAVPGTPYGSRASSLSNPGATSAETLLGSSVRRLYDKHNLKVTEDTLPAFSDSDLLREPSRLGSGAFHTVYGVRLAGSDGNSFSGVFKPLGSVDRAGNHAAHAAGIPSDDPQVAMRNLATLTYAKELGLDVIPDTRLGVLRTEDDSTTLGLVMERARGTEAYDAAPSVFRRGDVAAEVTKLQLLDHLTGQVDRHDGNYFIDAESDRPAKVTGIDNDQAFGASLTGPESNRFSADYSHKFFQGTKLPPVVDREMADAINGLSSSGIRRMLGDRLTEREVEAAVTRHQGVVQHIADLSAQGRIISADDWDRGSVQELLTPDNTYFGRERENAALRAKLRQGF